MTIIFTEVPFRKSHIKIKKVGVSFNFNPNLFLCANYIVIYVANTYVI